MNQSKGFQMLTQEIKIRITEQMGAALAAQAEKQSQRLGMSVTKSDVARMILADGLKLSKKALKG